MAIENDFHHLSLSADDLFSSQWFTLLSAGIELDAITSGRVGNHLTRPDDRGVPLVRTTTCYDSPPLCFTNDHDEVITRIKRALHVDHQIKLNEHPFNHALLEMYDQKYRKMGFHSDQALDLDPDSYIAIYSCYDRPPQGSIRRLSIKSKETDERLSIDLTQDSVVLFSVATNAKYLHKIHLPSGGNNGVRWLGLTLRYAKTYLSFDRHIPMLPDGQQLTLATDEQRSVFFKLRSQENRSTHFDYPTITYTISHGDLQAPRVAE